MRLKLLNALHINDLILCYFCVHVYMYATCIHVHVRHIKHSFKISSHHINSNYIFQMESVITCRCALHSWNPNRNSFHNVPVGIQVRIYSPNPLVFGIRQLNGAVFRMRPEKNEVLCHSRCDTIKILHTQRHWALSIGLTFAALHLQWWRLHISDKFLSGT
jgi:hypothetical protein